MVPHGQPTRNSRRRPAPIVGMTRPERVGQTLNLAVHPIPDDLWPRLDSLAYSDG